MFFRLWICRQNNNAWREFARSAHRLEGGRGAGPRIAPGGKRAFRAERGQAEIWGAVRLGIGFGRTAGSPGRAAGFSPGTKAPHLWPSGAGFRGVCGARQGGAVREPWVKGDGGPRVFCR